jgi:hypothetical protein
MNIFNATVRLIYEDARWFFCKLAILYSTLPVFLFWLIIGTTFELDNAIGAISGPMYFFIFFYAIIGYKAVLPIGMALGSTRKMMLKAFYSVGIVATVFCVMILNLLQCILATLYQRGISSTNILHFGRIFLKEYNFFQYLWIDLMFCIFIFGISFLFTCFLHRIGFVNMLIIIMFASILITLLYYLGILDAPIQWISGWNIKYFYFVTVLGIIGVSSLAGTYPLMANISLNKKATRI